MKRTISFLSFYLLTILCGCKKADQSKPATAKELSQMNRDFVKALNAKNAVAAANCYTKNATILPPNEAPVKGRANVQKYWGGDGIWNTDTLALK